MKGFLSKEHWNNNSPPCGRNIRRDPWRGANTSVLARGGGVRNWTYAFFMHPSNFYIQTDTVGPPLASRRAGRRCGWFAPLLLQPVFYHTVATQGQISNPAHSGGTTSPRRSSPPNLIPEKVRTRGLSPAPKSPRGQRATGVFHAPGARPVDWSATRPPADSFQR